MFINGISTGTFTVTAADLRFPTFGNNGLNSILIGGSISSPSSAINHWKGQISKLKISLDKKYTSPFTPNFDLSVNDYGIFLLQDNYKDIVSGKSLIVNNTVILNNTIPSSAPIILLNGS